MDRTVKRVIIFISIILISVVSLIVAVLTSNGGLAQNKFLANLSKTSEIEANVGNVTKESGENGLNNNTNGVFVQGDSNGNNNYSTNNKNDSNGSVESGLNGSNVNGSNINDSTENGSAKNGETESKNGNVANDNANVKKFTQIKRINVIFYYSDEANFTNEQMENFKNIIATQNDNDGIYSVREYFNDITFSKMDIHFYFETKFYDKNDLDDLHFRDYNYDSTINIYPVKANDNDSPYWASCNLIKSAIIVPKNTNTSTICHELIHTYFVRDLYVKNINNGEMVGGWDIMANNMYINPQFPLVHTISYITYLSESNYFDNESTCIERLNSSATVNIKATAYATLNDTFAIKIRGKDLGFTDENVVFYIEYRKPNGVKDESNPTNAPSLIVYRVNLKNRTNLVDNVEDTYIYVYRKFNAQNVTNSGLQPGDVYGSKGERTYNVIDMPNGENTGLVIRNIKFNSDNSCTFSVDFPSENEIMVSGAIMQNGVALSNCQIYIDGVLSDFCTNAKGKFLVTVKDKCKLQFMHNGVIVKEFDAVSSQRDLILYADKNVCKLTIENDVASVKICVNGDVKVYANKVIELMLKAGDEVVVSSDGYKDYKFTYESQTSVNVHLSENQKPNIVDRAINNISTNVNKAINSTVNIFNALKRAFK